MTHAIRQQLREVVETRLKRRRGAFAELRNLLHEAIGENLRGTNKTDIAKLESRPKDPTAREIRENAKRSGRRGKK